MPFCRRRVKGDGLASKPKKLSVARLLDWSGSNAQWRRIDTRHDALPGGLAMAMVPILIDWRASSLGFRPENYYLVRNVNLINNPISGVTWLGAIRVPADAVERVEFVQVLSKVARHEVDIAGHAMLRFIFKSDRCPVVLGGAAGDSCDWRLPDLVLSWEAWRPPGDGFDPVAGLDPKKYALSLRAYDGACRCLNDAILDRPWRCYPLQFPDIPDIANELLYVSLLLGDAVARHTIGNILDRRIDAECDAPEDYEDPHAEAWEQVKDAIRALDLPEDPIECILGGRTSYQLILRSCVTMALTSIDWTLARAYNRVRRNDPPRIRIAPDSLPGLLEELAHGHRRAALLRLPAALHWLIHHQSVIPGRSEQLLDDVGLLERANGKIVMHHFANRTESPYGRLSDNLIY
jgi:hypothetical protein